TRCLSDWSSDVCSSDLNGRILGRATLLRSAGAVTLAGTEGAATDRATAAMDGFSGAPPSYGPPGQTPGIPSDAELEAAGAVVGEIGRASCRAREWARRG